MHAGLLNTIYFRAEDDISRLDSIATQQHSQAYIHLTYKFQDSKMPPGKNDRKFPRNNALIACAECP